MIESLIGGRGSAHTEDWRLSGKPYEQRPAAEIEGASVGAGADQLTIDHEALLTNSCRSANE
ncbi:MULTISPECIES: hypothetical protein [Pseudomonas]|uniref:hypothetical protein n=1 Tax=Pseudomonas TaxID=286 RepID=UPI001E3BE6CF|nr:MULTISPECIES: hypothetical protein [Pseudomonas]MCE4069319.1 hypothetical protein [Pseudomonas nitritireducens]MCE4079517.1 hypothetical protein [Pseudomonas nitroreducens]